MADRELERRLQAAEAHARAAGAMAREFFLKRETLTIEAKADPQDIVSHADRSVETLLRAMVAEAFPGDGFLGEEEGLAEGTSGWTWVVDPIDGTSPFLHGMPHWCVSIAVMRGSETVIGAIFDPNENALYSGALGTGARLNNRPLRLDPALTLRNGMTGVGASYRTPPAQVGGLITALLADGGMFFRHGSGALMLAYVAAGRLAAYVEPHMHPWDCLAGLLLVREAGGWTAEYPGPDGLMQGGRIAAAGPGAAEGLRSLVARVGV
jgi:myo-inositol-1(or 4)-monophosphatase